MGFRDNVLQILESKNISKSDLAFNLRKSPQNLSMLLKKDSPSYNTVLEFAEVLGVEPSQLLGNHDTTTDLSSYGQIRNSNAFSRLFDYIHFKNIHPDDVSKKLNIPYISLYNAAVTGQEMSTIIVKALKGFEDLNITWVLTGQGKMLIDWDAFPDFGEYIDNPAGFYKRLQQYLESKDIPLDEWSEKIGIPKTIFADGLAGVYRVGSYDAIKTTEAFPDVNPFWLLTGEGDMLRSSLPRGQHNNDYQVLKRHNESEFALLSNNKILVTSPLITIVTREAYIKELADESFLKTLDQHAILLDRLKIGTYRSFEMVGTQMQSSSAMAIPDGSIVTGRKYDKPRLTGKALEFMHGTQFVIVTTNDVLVTEIISVDEPNSQYYYHQLNYEYSNVHKLYIEDVLELYQVEAVTHYRGEWTPERISKKDFDAFN